MGYLFPFGQPVKRLSQIDRTPKEAFILGVYASAVHAKWKRGARTVCRALAVASEPHIFWDGNPDDAKEIINAIKIPAEVGSLEPAYRGYNGPSARVLDECILTPLGLTREKTWLCDLLPESRLNPNQAKAIRERYGPLIKAHNLNDATVPAVNGNFCDETRMREILAEIECSQARTLILLGDDPIKQFLRRVAPVDFRGLRDYVEKHGYGTAYPVTLPGNRGIVVLPLAHPRQIGSLGKSNSFWFDIHRKWQEKMRSNPAQGSDI